MKHYKHMTEKEFDELKAILSLGIKPSKLRLSGITNRSYGILCLIRNNDTFHNYMQSLREKNDKTNGKKDTDESHAGVLPFLERIEKKLDQLLDRPL